MSINGISGYSQYNAYNIYSTNAKKQAEDTAALYKTKEEAGAVADKTNDTLPVIDATDATYTSTIKDTITPDPTDRSSIVRILQADQDARTKSLHDMVMGAVGGQLQNYGKAASVWQFLASGNYTVTEAAKKQAEEAISEGGIYSVENVSDRILEMAKALAGDDTSMIDKMRDAFKKGYEEATGAWGQELPEISSKTYDAVMDKFDKWTEEVSTITE